MRDTPIELMQKHLWVPHTAVALKQVMWSRALNDRIHPYVHADAMSAIVLRIQTTRVSRVLIYMMKEFV